jgi:hypothetical protein
MKHFLISYNKADHEWAEWIAWMLEEAGYSTIIQAWDFGPGSNFVLEMHQAAKDTERTIAVLSPDYLTAEYTHPEWAAAFARDPKGQKRTLIPVRVRKCKPDGLLAQIVYFDLVGRMKLRRANCCLRQPRAGGLSPRQNPDFPKHRKRKVRPRDSPARSPISGTSPIIAIRTSPAARNCFENLRAALTSGGTAAVIQAISGLGGVGKTQLGLVDSKRSGFWAWWQP